MRVVRIRRVVVHIPEREPALKVRVRIRSHGIEEVASKEIIRPKRGFAKHRQEIPDVVQLRIKYLC